MAVIKKQLTNQYVGQDLEEIYSGDIPQLTDKWRHRARYVDYRNRVALASSHVYTADEIDQFVITEAIQKHPLAGRPTNMRSKLAYQQILNQLKPTTKYLLPGQIVCFNYLEPKYKDELQYYDRTPMTLFLGIIRTKDNKIREIGLNLHYFPPFTRQRILNMTYYAFKSYFVKFFNNPSTKPNTVISWTALQHIMKRNDKLAFGIKMYIPTLRGKSYVLPTRLLPTAFYTEGHFSKATLKQVQTYWRQFKY